MPIHELRDRFYAVLKCYQEARDAFMAEIAKGLSISVNEEDITRVIAQEMTDACGILRARFEYFDKLAAAG